MRLASDLLGLAGFDSRHGIASPLCWRVAIPCLGALAWALAAPGSALAYGQAVSQPPPAERLALDACVAEGIPVSRTTAFHLRCGAFKLVGIATWRTENGKRVCALGPVEAGVEPEHLAEFPESWRLLPFSRLVPAGDSTGGARTDTAAEVWTVEPIALIRALLEEGDCVVSRFEADLEADGSRPTEFVSYVGVAEVAAVHARAVAGWELAARVRIARERAADESLSEQERADGANARSAVEREAEAWLGRGISTPSPYAHAAVAWVEELDARQSLLRARGEIAAADRMVSTMLRHVRAIGAQGVAQLIVDRVPAGSSGAASLCLHRCWVTDAAELYAVATREHAAQKRFVRELRESISSASSCGKEAVEVGGRSIDELMGALPPGSRFDARMKAIVEAELALLCDGQHDRTTLHVIAMTIALKAYSAAWSDAIKSYPELEHRAAAWHDALRREVASALESPPYSTALAAADMQAVLVLALARLEEVFNDGSSYFTAFPPSADLQAQLLRRFREASARRTLTGPEPAEASQAAIAHQVTSDLLEALYEGVALQALPNLGSDAYPRPFDFGPKSFRLWGRRLEWAIGP